MLTALPAEPPVVSAVSFDLCFTRCVRNTDPNRNFFPEHAFDKLTYESSDGVHAYEDYAAGNILKGKERKTSDAETTVTVMQVLRRHRSKRVDELLNWLVSSRASHCLPQLTQCRRMAPLLLSKQEISDPFESTCTPIESIARM